MHRPGGFIPAVNLLRNNLMLALTLVGLLLGAGRVGGAERATPPLETAAAVRSLSPEAAAQGRAVRLRGNLLLITAPRDAIVLLDQTEGIYIQLDHVEEHEQRLGDEIEVEGVTGAGDFAPIVQARRITWLGPGKLPVPRPTSIAELNAGGFDAAWVKLEGIVRSCVPTPPDQMPVGHVFDDHGTGVQSGHPAHESWMVTFAQGDDQMMVQINDHVSRESLVDATVRLAGVVFNVHNANRQFVRANMQVGSGAMVEVVTPPPADPFALPLQHVGEILRFSRTGFTGHRVHVHGVVTGHKDRHTLWLREGDRGLRVASQQEGTLRPGDEVEVVGFPEHGGYTPSISNAIFRKLSSGPEPVPQILRTSEEISREDSNLVQIEAELTSVQNTPDGLLLTLDWNGINVGARLLRNNGDADISAWQAGSRVRVAGICLLGQADFSRPAGLWVAEDLQLLMRDSRDLRVLRAAPWLTTRRALNIVISVAALMLLSLIVLALLARRQIRQREESRKLAEVEFSAMLAERNRLARDIHDTLAQDLNAVSMQLELAKNAAKAGPVEQVMSHLAAAHQIVRKSLAEARESIWNMRSHILERTDLLGALRSVAEQMSAGLNCTIRARLEGRPRRLAPMVENNLLRIGQEAVSNALKHARPRSIDLEIGFDDASVRLVVLDDGTGFDSAATVRSHSQFGLRGMKERVEQMHGIFRIGRAGAGGTRVEVVVDIPG